MKKIFKEAHKMTREMVKEYKVDYQIQFGLNLSYLLANKEEREMEFIKKVETRGVYEKEVKQIALLAAGRERPWLAEIKGFDSKYGYKREFLEKDEAKQRCYWYNVEEGQIYNWNEGEGQYFGIIENNTLYEISTQDVDNLLSK